MADAQFAQSGAAFAGRFPSGLAVAYGDERPVDLARDVAFEASHDFEFALALAGFPGDVVAGGPVVAHAHQGDVMQGPVALPAAAPVEPMPVGLAAGRGQRAGSAKLGERGLASDAFGVVARDGGELGGGDGTHAVDVEQRPGVLLQNQAHPLFQGFGPFPQFAP